MPFLTPTLLFDPGLGPAVEWTGLSTPQAEFPFDSKRWISENGVDTLAYGHEELVTRDAAAMDAYFDELVGGD